MVIIGGLTAIAVGIFCFTDSEIAWRLYELDCQFWGQSVEQPKDWRDWVHATGATLVILGLMVIFAGIQLY